MVQEINCDIFKAPIDILVQCLNCQVTQSSGIAKDIREKWSELWEADLKTTKGDKKKLGTFCHARIKKPTCRIQYLVGIYGQYDFGGDGRRYGSYDAIVDGLSLLRDSLITNEKEDLVLGLPYKFASDRAGCDWSIVDAIIHSVFEESPIKVLICKKPELS